MDPVTWAAIIAAVAAGVGAYSTNQADKAVRKDQAEKTALERARQQQLGAEADRRNADELARFQLSNQEAERANITQKLAEQYQASAGTGAPPESQQLMNPGAGEANAKDLARTISEAVAKGRTSAKTQATLAGFGSQNLNNSIALGRNAQEQSRIGNFSQSSLGLLPYELQNSFRKGANWRTTGDVANAIAMAASIYAGGAAGAGAAGGAGAGAAGTTGLTATTGTSATTAGSLGLASGSQGLSLGAAGGGAAGMGLGGGFRYLAR